MDDPIARFRAEIAAVPSCSALKAIAEASGINWKTLHNLRQGKTRSMHYDHVKQLADYYAKLDHEDATQ